MPPIVSVVTPSFNSADFLGMTLDSVIGQFGDFVLHYHVQDGGSTDGTVELVRERMARIAAGERVHCAGVKLTLSVEPDRGMYDAINRGFAALALDESALMTWINSDDLLAPGAIHTALSIAQSLPDVAWLGGRMSQIDALGSIIRVHPPFVYSSVALQEGKCDGREGRFVQQEGTFWRSQLWKAVGGLDASFKLAGDWDLWRRFAKHADYSVVDSVLGFHRRHIGQLSANLEHYFAEVDARKKKSESIHDIRRSQIGPQYVSYDAQTRSWITPEPPLEAKAAFIPSLAISARDSVNPSPKIQFVDGFFKIDGPPADTYIACVPSGPKVEAGDTIKASVSFNLRDPATLLIALNRHGTTPFEGSPVLRAECAAGKNELFLQHTFKAAHDTVRIQIASGGDPVFISGITSMRGA